MEEYGDVVQQVATETKRQFPIVERDDLVQEGWLWLAEHTEKLDEWGTGKGAMGRVAKALRRRLRAYALKEKAAKTGYDFEDVYFYSTGLLRELIPQALDRTVWVEPGVAAETGKISRTGDPAEGGNRIAMLCDVRASLEAGSEADKELLWTVFGLCMPEDEYAMHLEITVEALRTRVHRAVQRVQRRLGGPKPDGPYVGTRRSISNAQAQAITRNQESEE